MRIAILNNNLGEAGGAERYTHDVATGFEQRNHQIFLGDLSGDVLGDLEKFNPEVVYLQNVFDLALTEGILAKYPTWRFIHDHQTYCPGSSKYWFRSNKICPVPFSYSCALSGFTQHCMSRRPAKIWRELRTKPKLLETTRNLRGLIVASQFMKEQLVLNQVPTEKITVNPLFISPDWEAIISSAQVTESSPPAILFIGRVFIEKGVEYLLRSCQLLDASYQLKIIGDGWDLERLRGLAKSWGLKDRVEFSGWLGHSEVARHLASCRMLVVPSIWPEPFGIIGLEAMAWAKPVVAFDSGSISAWLRDGQNGFLVPRLDVSVLAEKIDQLLNHPSLAIRLGQRGREIVRSEFTIARHVKVLEEVFGHAVS